MKIGDRIAEFIERVGCDPDRSLVREGPLITILGEQPSQRPQALIDEEKKQHEAVAKLHEFARELAADLEKLSEDSTSLLLLLDLARDGCSGEVVEAWRDVRVWLQRIGLKQDAKPPMNDRQREQFSIIREHGAIQEKDLENRLSITLGKGTFRKHDLPILKAHGVRNVGQGYFVAP